MAQDSGGDEDYVDWNTDDDLEIDNFQFSPSSSPVQPRAETLVGLAVATTSSNSPAETTDLVQMGFSDEIFASLYDMGFSLEMINRAIKETGPNAETSVIIDTISKYSSDCEAGSSKSKAIDHFLAMGFDEQKVIKAIHEHGEENMEDIANALLPCAEPEKSPVVKEEYDIDWSSEDDDVNYDMLVSDDENDPNSNENNNQMRSLVRMGFSELEASLAVERCGENVDIAELTDFLCAAQMARQFSEFHTDPEERKPDNKKRRIESKREPRSSADVEPVRLPNPMIGFGVPNEPGLITHRSLPKIAQGAPYFYYENVALAPIGVWETISRHLYGIAPEFVDSKYFCVANRKRGYIHNLPINNRFQIQPPQKYTINEAFPLSKQWWPAWDKRTKLNCILTVTGSAKLTNRIRNALRPHIGEPEPPQHVQRYVIDQCRKWNLVWVGQNKAAPLEPDEMENILGFPRNHTRGGGMSRTERIKSLGNSFQVDTVAYHLSVLKPMFPNGINVLSLFTGIGGGEVALHRLKIPMKVVVSVEITESNREILKDFWAQTKQKGVLVEFSDVQDLSNEKIERLMDKFGGFDLVIGGSPCNNLAGGNRVSRNGLEGDQSSLFFEYCRILEVVRARMARRAR
ncbi:DNA (cytosine-5)-methyltransferase DRM2 [Cardamine amara subsp. amara]|uniref:DNA (cytosine-5-)-methyltransferase n=1 Tax=Cardamine amara subsp. amara TaxID=228776 RepID=A0ABD1AGS1_CARAN